MVKKFPKKKLDEIATTYSDPSSSKILGRLQEAGDFESEVIAVLLTQSERFIDDKMPVTFNHFPSIYEYVNIPQNNNLHHNPIFLDYVIGALKDFTAKTFYSTKKLADEIRSFSNQTYKKIHEHLPATISDKDATEIVSSLYSWHIKPSLAASEIMLKHTRQNKLSKNPTFQKDINTFNSIFDTIYKRLNTRHPYAFIDKQFDTQVSDVFSKTSKDHINKNYQHDTKHLERNIIINLYTAAYLLHYIAHAQIMHHSHTYTNGSRQARKQKINTKENSTKLTAALQEALKATDQNHKIGPTS